MTAPSVGWADSPVGPLRAVTRGDTLLELSFAPRAGDGAPPRPIARALEAYFAGEVTALDDIPVAPRGTTFQLRVWTALRRIPAGETCTYADLARAVGEPTATRAVGAASGKNPIAIVVPCHRVVGADGSLTGYGGGLDRKRWLLAHELRSTFRLRPR